MPRRSRKDVVHLELTDEQQLLRETTRRFIEERRPIAEVRRIADGPVAHDPSLLSAAGELGWFAPFVPEGFGGGTVSGSPVRDAVIVAEERGRLVQPGPFVATNVVADAVAREGSPAQRLAHLAPLAAGERSAAWAIGDRSGVPEPVVRLRSAGDGVQLDGVAGAVADASDAGLFLLSALDGTGTTQVLVPAATPGLTVVPLHGLDLTRRFADVRFDEVRLGPDAVVGARGGADAAIRRQLDVAATLTVAESVGAMQRLLEMTVEYSRNRIAFGRPIGSFQALKHLLADASLACEISAAAADAAAEAVAEERPSASEIVSIAASYAGDAGVEVAQTCLQVHGGIGFTWEHDLHLYLRRLQTDRVLYGDPAWHRERICRLHGLGGAR